MQGSQQAAWELRQIAIGLKAAGTRKEPIAQECHYWRNSRYGTYVEEHLSYWLGDDRGHVFSPVVRCPS